MYYGIINERAGRLVAAGLSQAEAAEDMDNRLFGLPMPRRIYFYLITERLYRAGHGAPAVWASELEAFDLAEPNDERRTLCITERAFTYLLSHGDPANIAWSDRRQAYDCVS